MAAIHRCSRCERSANPRDYSARRASPGCRSRCKSAYCTVRWSSSCCCSSSGSTGERSACRMMDSPADWSGHSSMAPRSAEHNPRRGSATPDRVRLPCTGRCTGRDMGRALTRLLCSTLSHFCTGMDSDSTDPDCSDQRSTRAELRRNSPRDNRLRGMPRSGNSRRTASTTGTARCRVAESS